MLLSTGQGVIGHNCYAYCGNTPATGVDPSKITVGLNEIEEQTETVLSGVYNLYGQKVSSDGKGLLIRNGKLIFVK